MNFGVQKELFQRDLKKYEGGSEERVSVVMKIGIVLKMMPDSQRKVHLLFNSEQYTQWGTFREAISSRGRTPRVDHQVWPCHLESFERGRG